MWERDRPIRSSTGTTDVGKTAAGLSGHFALPQWHKFGGRLLMPCCAGRLVHIQFEDRGERHEGVWTISILGSNVAKSLRAIDE